MSGVMVVVVGLLIVLILVLASAVSACWLAVDELREKLSAVNKRVIDLEIHEIMGKRKEGHRDEAFENSISA